MSEYVHHYSKIHVNNVAKVRDWLQAGSLPKSSLPTQTSNEVTTQAERMKTLSLNEARGGELNSKAKDAISKIKEDFYRADETVTSGCKKLKNNVSTNVSSKTTKSEEHCTCRDCALNELCSMFPKMNPHQLYMHLASRKFDLQRAIESLLDIPSPDDKSGHIPRTDSCLSASGLGNLVPVTSRTEARPHHLKTEITVNSRTRRKSPTVSGTKSSLVSSNITCTTPHTLQTRSIRTGQKSLQGSLSVLRHRIDKLKHIPRTDSCLSASESGNFDSVTSVTEARPHHLKTEITVNSRIRRRSPTISGTKSSVVLSNVTCSTPHTLDTRSILTGQRSHQGSISTPVSPMSPVFQPAPLSPIPPCPECPVCFSSLAGSRIFQCAQGHSLCGDCNKNPQVKNCPTCRGKLVGRATNMEQLLDSIYSGE